MDSKKLKDVNWQDTADEISWEDVPWNYRELGPGAKLVGLYVGRKGNLGKNGSTLHMVESEGSVYSFWGTDVLNKRLVNVKSGEELVRIEYLGMAKNEKTRRNYHNFKVFKAPIVGMINDEDIEEVKDAF